MNEPPDIENDEEGTKPPHRRRARYSGTHPRQFHERYKEHDPQAYPEEHEHIRTRGRTPAGTHVPIMVDEVLRLLDPRAGEMAADCTLGYGGHGEALLRRLAPGGRLVGFDVDGEQLQRTADRLRGLNIDAAVSVRRSNFAGLAKSLAAEGIDGYDVIFADLGVSSMQIDDPLRGFSYKHDGPLDMRMDSRLKRTAADVLADMSADDLAAALVELADEEDAAAIAGEIGRRRSSRPIRRTLELADAVLTAKGMSPRDWKRAKSAEPGLQHPAARTFQALRMLVNDELGSLTALLREAPWCLRPAGRIGVLSFHSGEDRLVKHAFADGLRGGMYSAIADEVVRPSAAEVASNPRSRPAKFRWAVRAGA